MTSQTNAGGIYQVNFRLDSRLPSENGMNSCAGFSRDVLGDFILRGVGITYHIDTHPEFEELLEDLRINKRIPKEELRYALEPAIMNGKNGLEGHVYYYFGIPKEDRLCIRVDKDKKEYFPEAEEQSDQGTDHVCMHGEDAPFNPFKKPDSSPSFSKIRINLSYSGNHNPESRYLEEFLEGLPLPADGISLDGYFGSKSAYITLTTPEDHFLDIWVNNPETEEDFEKAVALARRLENMFNIN